MKEFKSKFSINCEMNMKKLSNVFFALLFIFLGLSLFAHSALASTVGPRVYVANYGFGVGNGSVSVINTATNSVIANITVAPGPWNMAMSGDGTRLYVSSAGSNIISVIDTGTNTVSATISVSNSPAGMVLN